MLLSGVVVFVFTKFQRDFECFYYYTVRSNDVKVLKSH